MIYISIFGAISISTCRTVPLSTSITVYVINKIKLSFCSVVLHLLVFCELVATVMSISLSMLITFCGGCNSYDFFYADWFGSSCGVLYADWFGSSCGVLYADWFGSSCSVLYADWFGSSCGILLC